MVLVVQWMESELEGIIEINGNIVPTLNETFLVMQPFLFHKCVHRFSKN